MGCRRECAAVALLTDRYAAPIAAVVWCYDRLVIRGTLPGVCYAAGMAAYPRTHGIRLFDYPRFVEPLREEIRQNAEQLAREHGLEIESIRAVRAFRKEGRIHAILAKRGDQPGLSHVFAALEPCAAFTPWRDKATGTTTLLHGREVPVLLLLLHRCGVRPLLSAGPDVGPVPAAVLLQRP